MTDHYEDTEDQKERVLKNSQVLAFIARFWMRRPWLLTGTIVFVVLAIAFGAFWLIARTRRTKG